MISRTFSSTISNGIIILTAWLCIQIGYAGQAVCIIHSEKGQYYELGYSVNQACRLALKLKPVDENNSIEWLFIDDMGEPDIARAKLLPLLQDSALLAILGGYPDSCAEVISGLAESFEVPYLILSSNADFLTLDSLEWTFRINAPQKFENEGCIGWLLNSIDHRRPIGLFYDRSESFKPTAIDWYLDLKKNWAGKRVVVPFSTHSLYFGKEIDALEGESVAAVILIGNSKDIERFTRQCRTKDWMPPAFLIGSEAIKDSLTGINSSHTLNFSIAPGLWRDDRELEYIRRFIARYEAFTGKQATSHAAYAFSAMEVMFQVLEGGNISRNQLRDTLETGNFSTVVGTVNYQNFGGYYHQHIVRSFAGQYQDNSWVPIFPRRYHDDKFIFPIPEWKERETEPGNGANTLNYTLVTIAIILVFYLLKRKQK